VAEETKTETKTYFLKPGMEHGQIVAGEYSALKGDNGDSAELTSEQYEAFKDKFLPAGVKPPKPEPVAPAEDKAPAPTPAPTPAPKA
jgi:hypothetical protein